MSDRVQLTQTIVSEGDTRGEGVGLLVLALAFAALAVFLMAFPGAPIAALIGGALVMVLAVAVLRIAAKAIRTSRRMDPGVVHVPTTSFLLSSTVPARFHRRIKRGSREVRSVTARLVLREWVRYTVGTDSRTATHDVAVLPVPVNWVPDPDGVAAELELSFPAYPPSFEAASSRVRWLLVVDIVLADGFDDDSELPLCVVPAALAPVEA